MAVHGRKWPYALERRSAVGLLLLASALCARGAERLVEFPNIGALLAHARATQGDPAERIKVRGVVTYNHRGKSLFIQDQTGAVYAGCAKEQKVRAGDEVEVLGKLNRSGFSPIVVSASTVRTAQGALPLPAEMQLDAAVRGEYDMRLVSFVATVGACYDHGRTLTFTVITNGVPLNVELAKDGPGNPFSSVAMNSTVRLQGICSVKADFDRTIRSIMILMRSPADLTVLSPPPYWTARRVGIVTVAVVGIAAAALAWVYALRGQVRIKTAEIARLNEQLEQKVKARTTELETVNLELQAFTHSVPTTSKRQFEPSRIFPDS